MGLFDHLFKTKSPPHEEKVVESAPEGGSPAKTAEPPPRTPLPQRADPSAFLHPKNFVPRGAPSLTPAPRPGASTASRPTERRTASGGPAPAADEIVLTLGDVLSRIPTHYLKAGAHDAKRELRFKINDLSSDIARGRAAVPLSRIAQLVPDIFVKEIGRDEDTEVRLPLQKLVEQIGLLRSRPKPSVFEKAARPAALADAAPASRVVDIDAKKEVPQTPTVSSAPAPGVEQTFRPVISPPQTPSIILGEQALAGQKSFELKPAVEQTGTPVILGPARTVEPTPAAPVSEAPVPAPAPEPAPEPIIAPAAPVLAEAPATAGMPEPAPPSPPAALPISEIPPGVPPAAAPAPEIVIDWAAEARTAAEAEPEAKAPEAVVDVYRHRPGSEPQKLAPLESPNLDSGEEKIQLSLAAILRHCPPEIIIGQLPHVDDSVRISLPFAPIDRQLVKGQVEVSALRFIAALPEAYHKYFIAKIGVKVPIPLEEVFQNLPTPTHELTPAPPTSPNVVLKPAAGFGGAPAETAHKIEGLTGVPAAPSAPPLPIIPVPAPATEAAASVAPGTDVSALSEPTHEEQAAGSVGPVDEAGIPFSIFKPAASPEPGEPVPAVSETSDFTAPAPETASPLPPPPHPLHVSGPVAPVAETPEAPAAAASLDAQPLAVTEEVSTEMGPATTTPAPLVSAPEPHEATAATPVEPAATLPAQDQTATSSPGEPVHEASEAPPKLVLQRPVFRPFVVPPPPIFGFSPPPAAPAEAESVPRVEPPSLISSLMESAPPAAEAVDPGRLPADSESAGIAAPIISEAAPLDLESAPIASTQEAAATDHLVATPAEPTPPAAVESKAEPVATVPGPEDEAAPTSEMIASALEDVAPETIIPFSLQPAPFADLTELLAHETTYAPDLAEVVHVDVPAEETGARAKPDLNRPIETAEVPSEESERPAAPVALEAEAEKPAEVPAEQGITAEIPAPSATEQPAAPAEHAPGPALEAAAAAAAIVAVGAEILPHREHEAAPVPEHRETVAEQPAPPLPAEETEHRAAEPFVGEHAVVSPVTEPPVEAVSTAPEEAAVMPAEVLTTPVAESAKPEQPQIPEAPTLPPTPEAPAAPEPERPAAAVPPPPPIPLFPLQKFPTEPAHLEVLPPPPLPLRRFDQDAVQALFMTEEALDLPKISRLAASLPGVYACVIATRDQACTGGNLPDGFDLAALLGLAPRVGEAAGRMPIGQLKHFTLYGDAYSVSFFERNGLSLCAVHRPRSFVPGVREKLVALADELSR